MCSRTGKAKVGIRNHNQVLELCQKALVSQQEWSPNNNPDFAFTFNKLASIQNRLDDWLSALAVEQYNNTLAIRRNAVSSNYPDLAWNDSDLGWANGQTEVGKRGCDSIEEAVRITQRSSSADHPHLQSYREGPIEYRRRVWTLSIQSRSFFSKNALQRIIVRRFCFFYALSQTVMCCRVQDQNGDYLDHSLAHGEWEKIDPCGERVEIFFFVTRQHLDGVHFDEKHEIRTILFGAMSLSLYRFGRHICQSDGWRFRFGSSLLFRIIVQKLFTAHMAFDSWLFLCCTTMISSKLSKSQSGNTHISYKRSKSSEREWTMTCDFVVSQRRGYQDIHYKYY